MSETDLKFDDEEGAQAFEHYEIPPQRELVTYPYDPPVKTLVREIADKDLIVNPPFQRRAVWDRGRKSRLIESLLLNIPVPVCFFAEDEDGRKVVVDGQQRLRAIEEFVNGQYRLVGLQVLADLNRFRWTDLTPRQARLIENRVIRCIVISEKSDPNIRFEVFERLNTGVVPLTDQELRNCVYRGEFNEFLNGLSTDPSWLTLLRRREPDNRLRHHELILRFFAFNANFPEYRPPLKRFLNDFMRVHRHATVDARSQFHEDFHKSVSNVRYIFQQNAFRRLMKDKAGSLRWDNTLNRAIFDIQMVGLKDIDQKLLKGKSGDIIEMFARLCTEDATFTDAVTKATADRTKVLLRLRRFGEGLREIGIEPPWLETLPEQ